MKKHFFCFATVFLFFFSMILPGQALGGAKTVRVGVFIVDPLIKKVSDGKYAGSVIEVLEDIASKENWTLQYTECKFPVCLGLLESGQLDLMGSITRTEDRIERFDFTDETFLMDWGQIYSAPKVEINNILDLDNKKIAVLRNTAQYPPFETLLKSFGINAEIVFVDDYLDVFRFVEEGKTDALMINRLFGEKNFKNYRIHRTSIIFTPMDIRYATPKGLNKDIRDAIDRHLVELKQDKDSIYYSAINGMFGSGSWLSSFPDWAKGVLYISIGLSVFLFLNGRYLKKLVKARTSSLENEIGNRKAAENILTASRESFRDLVESTDTIHWEMDFTTDKFTYVSPQIQKILGFSPERWDTFQSWAETIHPDDREWASRFCKEETVKDRNHEFVYRAVAADGRTVWLRDVVKVISNEKGPQKLIGIIFDITSQKNIEKALKHSEHFLQSIIENEPECVKLLNSNGELVSMNRSGLDMIQAESLEQVRGHQVYPLIDPEFRDEFRRLTEDVCAGATGSLVFKVTGLKGRESWLESKAVPFYDEREDRTLLLSVTRDITDRVMYEARLKRTISEKEALLKEVHHRVKNNMQIISSLASIQARFVKDEDDKRIFEESQNRIRSMALVHEKLYQSDNFQDIDVSSYLAAITHHLMVSTGAEGNGITCQLDVDNVSLPMEKLIPCGLIVTELVTNSIKHAFNGENEGEITIALRRTDGEGFSLSVRDNGSGIPEDIATDGLETLGFLLLNTLAHQLNAEICFTSTTGTKVDIQFACPGEETGI